MTTVIDSLVEILDNYYFPEGEVRSMYAVLGPVNVILKEFRRLREVDEQKIAGIAGIAYRAIEQANPKGVYPEAAVKLQEVVKRMAQEAPLNNRRELKAYLKNIRYGVYLRKMISKYEYIEKKRKKEKKEE